SYTSPTGDNGTLSGTFTYSTPDGQSLTFNSSGYMTKWTSADGNEVLTYTYDGSNRLSTINAIDGGVTTFTYNTNQVVIQTVNSRLTTLTLSSGDLTAVTNPDGGVHTFSYDGSTHRLTREQCGAYVENNWAYTSAAVLGTMTQGATSVGGVTNLDRTVPGPANVQGLSALVAGTMVYASSTDPTAHVEKWSLDAQGRPLVYIAGDGGKTVWGYTNGYMTKETDALNQITTLTRDGSGYITKEELPDGSVLTYQYQSAFHALTTMIDERGGTFTYAYDGSGHLTSETDALSNRSTYTYTGGGLLETVKDALTNLSTFQYDSARRLTVEIDAAGNRVTTTYDNNGNESTITDAVGVTTFMNDVMGRTTVVIDALSGRVTTTYDVTGLELTTTDQLATQDSTTYDSFLRGLVVQTTAGARAGVTARGLHEYGHWGG